MQEDHKFEAVLRNAASLRAARATHTSYQERMKLIFPLYPKIGCQAHPRMSPMTPKLEDLDIQYDHIMEPDLYPRWEPHH